MLEYEILQYSYPLNKILPSSPSTSLRGLKECYSDPVTCIGYSDRTTDKRYARDNRVIADERTNRLGTLPPRCRLSTSYR
ncbi:hypothetical protein CROQUDRAFT_666934 [Cronartium quercuum f. sp. fusiforme G11]|uniref:Uncharacterized protein n=1 Tax=Cronartium quercuum f. sp. fusiforme G11 TaxID=708437 RepID=A0A9P6N7G0_9BASI|nr:hypothetical protein CROQUDRAFT_666934 [Cronartium quercuum f. sp. fusiforme G11]